LWRRRPSSTRSSPGHSTNRFDIRESVAIDYRLFAVIGGIAALAFAVSLGAMLRGRVWSYRALIVLALVDIVGEFIAQGRLGIALNVSFLVALTVLTLALAELRTRRLTSHGNAASEFGSSVHLSHGEEQPKAGRAERSCE
jgi:hypothetical protein